MTTRSNKPVKNASVRQAERHERYLHALRKISTMTEVDGSISADAKRIALEALNEERSWIDDMRNNENR